MEYLNFDEFELEVKKLASPSDFAAKQHLLKLIPFAAYETFKRGLLKGNTIHESYNYALTVFKYGKV